MCIRVASIMSFCVFPGVTHQSQQGVEFPVAFVAVVREVG
jgi:hypothetical protein